MNLRSNAKIRTDLDHVGGVELASPGHDGRHAVGVVQLEFVRTQCIASVNRRLANIHQETHPDDVTSFEAHKYDVLDLFYLWKCHLNLLQLEPVRRKGPAEAIRKMSELRSSFQKDLAKKLDITTPRVSLKAVHALLEELKLALQLFEIFDTDVNDGAKHVQPKSDKP